MFVNCLIAAYNELVVSFFKQPNIQGVLQRKQPGISQDVLYVWSTCFAVLLMALIFCRDLPRNKAGDVASRGDAALADLANDIDFVMLLRYVSCIVRVYCYFVVILSVLPMHPS